MAQMIYYKAEEIMDMESRHVCWGEQGERGKDGDSGVGRCRLLCLEWMGYGVLLYSTGNSVQSLGLERDGK